MKTEKEIIELRDQIEKFRPEIQDSYNIFNLKFANEWMESAAQTPPRTELFGEFWLEGELALLFSDTNLGKSTLAMQIAESIARGKVIAPMTQVPKAQRVLYIDFEMNEKQFEMRYSRQDKDGNIIARYEFSDNLLRAQMAAHDDLPDGYKSVADFISTSLVRLLEETRARILIIDNITYLKDANENAHSAARLMKGLRWMKERYGLSILVLAHTPKLPYTAPLSVNNIQGSKMLSNFSDNITALGGSNQAMDLRYLKSLKRGETAVIHGTSNVILFRLKREKNFLRFVFEGYAFERNHLNWQREYIDQTRGQKMMIAKTLYSQGATIRRIAFMMEMAPSTVLRYLKGATPGDERLLKEKDVERLQEEEL